MGNFIDKKFKQNVTEPLDKLWNDAFGDGGITDSIWNSIISASSWLDEKMSSSVERIKTTVMDYLNKTHDRFAEIGAMVKLAPERLSLAVQGLWIDIESSVKSAFVNFGSWLASIIPKMQAFIEEFLYNKSGNLIGSAESVQAAKDKVSQGNISRQADLDAIDLEAIKKRNVLEERYKELEAKSSKSSGTVNNINAAKGGDTIYQGTVNTGSVTQHFTGGTTAVMTPAPGGIGQ